MFDNGGWKDTLENLALNYEDQLAPFRSLIGQNSPTNFSGTVVRLALRSDTSQSRISTDRPDGQKIHNLLVDFIQQELHVVMLFLTHLSSIEVREIDEGGLEVVLATATATTWQHSKTSAPFILDNRKISVDYHPSIALPSASCTWLVIRAAFQTDECIVDLANALSDSVERVMEELGREKLRPDIALAFPMSPISAKDLDGRLFTFLPLPLETGFPCHIHSVFSLTDSRQNLRNPSETIMPGTADACVRTLLSTDHEKTDHLEQSRRCMEQAALQQVHSPGMARAPRVGRVRASCLRHVRPPPASSGSQDERRCEVLDISAPRRYHPGSCS